MPRVPRVHENRTDFWPHFPALRFHQARPRSAALSTFFWNRIERIRLHLCNVSYWVAGIISFSTATSRSRL